MALQNLPEDILLDVFEYLPPNALINAAETCPLWSDIIKNSSHLMRRFKIHIQQDTTEINLTDGQHQNVEIEYYRHYFNPDRLVTIKSTIATYQSSIKYVNLKFVHLNTFGTYAELLENLHQLTTLKIEACRVKNENTNGNVQLPSLRELDVNRSSLKFFRLLECNQITKLKFSSYSQLDGSEVYFADFLQRSENLRDLKLGGTARKFLDTTRNYEFRLTKLTMDSTMDTKDGILSFIDFLKVQKQTLRHLIVYNAPRELVLKSIFVDLTNLTRLELGIQQLPEKINYFHTLTKNFSLRTLHLYGRCPSQQDIRGILQHYPNIESLKFLECPSVDISELLFEISDGLKNLKHLTIPCLPGIVSPVINFSNLVSLEVEELSTAAEVTNWTYLVIYSPNVERLIVRQVENDNLSNSMIGAVMSKAKKLCELDLGRNFEYNEQALNFIKMTARNLKKFQIFTRNIENMKTLVERIHGDGLNCFVYEIHQNDPPQPIAISQFNSGTPSYEPRDQPRAIDRQRQMERMRDFFRAFPGHEDRRRRFILQRRQRQLEARRDAPHQRLARAFFQDGFFRRGRFAEQNDASDDSDSDEANGEVEMIEFANGNNPHFEH